MTVLLQTTEAWESALRSACREHPKATPRRMLNATPSEPRPRGKVSRRQQLRGLAFRCSLGTPNGQHDGERGDRQYEACGCRSHGVIMHRQQRLCDTAGVRSQRRWYRDSTEHDVEVRKPALYRPAIAIVLVPC